MILTDAYRSVPGCCSVCGSSAPGPVIDLQRQDGTLTVRYGSLYLCVNCGAEVARLYARATGQELVDPQRLVDSVPTEDYIAQVERANAAEAKVAGLREALA